MFVKCGHAEMDVSATARFLAERLTDNVSRFLTLKTTKAMKNIAIAFLSACLGALLTGWVIQPSQPLNAAQSLKVPPASRPNQTIWNASGLTPDEAAGAMVYENNNRSVANIATRIGGERFLFRENPAEDAGSGFVIDMNGHIMTNFHVVEDAARITVTLFNGVTYDARPVGVDPINDIAVLKIEAKQDELFPVRIADSSVLKVGMKVFAIGNPFGLHRTMTTGIVSSLNRTLPVSRVRSIKSVIQIDAAINPGNSGGPLFDSQGRLIGMNTAIASRTGQNSGIGFAIPSNLLKRVIPELLEHGRVLRPDIGIAEVLQTEKGLRVLRLDPNGPADTAGIRGPSIRRRQSGIVVWQYEDRSAADLIVGVNGKETLNVDEFLSEIESHRPGETVTLYILRNEKPLRIDVVLGE